MLTQQEIANVFEDFLNNNGLFYAFKEFIEGMGYKIEEFGIKDDE